MAEAELGIEYQAEIWYSIEVLDKCQLVLTSLIAQHSYSTIADRHVAVRSLS